MAWIGMAGESRQATGDEIANAKITGRFDDSSPSYLSDLNAMHEAEKVLETGLRGRYLLNLEQTTNNTEQKAWPEVTATAPQRAEAFLRTLNLYIP